MVTLFDMSSETQLSLFANSRTLSAARRHSAKNGVLEGSEMARVFAWLRPNDLIWNYWINNYLLGHPPPAFDVLFWNADTTRLPARFHSDLLKLIETNDLIKGRLKISGERIELARIKCDYFAMAGRTDHITPWPACYRAMKFLGGQGEFVLSTGGHIQSCWPRRTTPRITISSLPNALKTPRNGWPEPAAARVAGGCIGGHGYANVRDRRKRPQAHWAMIVIRRWNRRQALISMGDHHAQ